MKTRTRTPRGFSLVELLVASTLMILAVTFATVGFLSQNKALQAVDLTRVANESTRDALLQLERTLRTAGWGVHPGTALDFTYGCAANANCRDSTTGSDELAFISRNPLYRWVQQGEPLTPLLNCADAQGCFEGNAWRSEDVDSAAGTVKITLRAGQLLELGRLMLVTCSSGANPVLITLDDRYDTAGPVTLRAAPTADARYNNAAALTSCHEEPGAAVFMVDRYRYFVRTYGDATYLMLDRGLDLNDNGVLPTTDADDLIPVARNVEDLQVAYVYGSNAGFTPVAVNWVVGDGSPAEEPNELLAPPDYNAPNGDGTRYTQSPANVRAVRLSLTVRSPRRDQTQALNWGEPIPAAENRAALPRNDGLRRYFTRSEVTLRNLDARSSFIF